MFATMVIYLPMYVSAVLAALVMVELLDRYQRVLKPMHQLHIEPTKKFANIIIPEGGNNEVAINLITDYIKGRLTANKK